jgi:BASS family bile acid:Na+ symporter
MSEQPPKTPNNNELAIERTNMAQERTSMAEQRTEMSVKRTDMAGERTVLAVERTDLAETRTELARERTRAAQERTLMAWIRTSLSMISFGFGIDRFFKYLDKTETGSGVNTLTEERILGLSLMSLGIFALAASLVTHWQTLRNIDKKEYKYIPQWSQGFTVGIILLFIGLAAFIPLLTVDFNLSEIFTLDSKVIQNLVALTLFLIMLTMGVKIPLSDLLSLINKPLLLGKSLISVLVLFPLIVAIVLSIFHLPESTIIAFAILAAAPAPPLLTKRSIMAGGNVQFSASLQVILSLLAVVVTPLILLILMEFSP